jgi:hypothetical protein
MIPAQEYFLEVVIPEIYPSKQAFEIGEPDIPRKDYSSDLAHPWVRNT